MSKLPSSLLELLHSSLFVVVASSSNWRSSVILNLHPSTFPTKIQLCASLLTITLIFRALVPSECPHEALILGSLSGITWKARETGRCIISLRITKHTEIKPRIRTWEKNPYLCEFNGLCWGRSYQVVKQYKHSNVILNLPQRSFFTLDSKDIDLRWKFSGEELATASMGDPYPFIQQFHSI